MISKTDFLIYLDSPLHLWAVKNNKIEKKILDEYTQHILEQGYDVEELAIKYAKEYLTKEYGITKKDLLIQPTHKYDNYEARTDILIFNPKTDKWDIYEVKSSTSVKKTHRYDLTFQYLVFKENYDIGDTYVLHLNKEYIKDGDIYLSDLFVRENVNEYVQDLKDEVLEERYNAYLISKEKESRGIEGCIKPKVCPCISLCHPKLPKYSIYDINKLTGNEKKVRELEGMNILDIMDLPKDFKLTPKQRFQVNVAQSKKTYMDRGSIKERLNQLIYPIYFLDYETFNPAIPIFNGYKPFWPIVFQYSLHIKRAKNAKLEHHEYIHTKKSDPLPTLLPSLEKLLQGSGSIVVWNKTFEATRNKEMGEIYPEYEDFTNDMNERMFDLMRIFQDQLYDDPLFKGSYSIKNVLPVLVDDLSYEGMSIGEGATAMVNWYDMVFKDGKDIKKELLEYCKLDTLAMVKVFEELIKHTETTL
jgi:hypothetical protein